MKIIAFSIKILHNKIGKQSGKYNIPEYKIKSGCSYAIWFMRIAVKIFEDR